MNSDLDAFKRLLEPLAQRFGASKTLLSALGHQLKRQSPGFDPRDFGHSSLQVLLGLCTDVGEVGRNPDGHPWFRFHEGAQSGGRLRSDVWKKVTDFRPPEGGWHWDLAINRPCAPKMAVELLESEPERLLAMPAGGVEFQKGLARDFAAAKGLPIDALEATLAAPHWLSGVATFFEQEGVFGAWNTWRHEQLVDLALSWARAHEIPEALLRRQERLHERPTRPTVLPSSNSDLRARLHTLIDALSDEELRQLSLPAWCLGRA